MRSYFYYFKVFYSFFYAFPLTFYFLCSLRNIVRESIQYKTTQILFSHKLQSFSFSLLLYLITFRYLNLKFQTYYYPAEIELLILKSKTD